jgi:hypothetical protein
MNFLTYTCVLSLVLSANSFTMTHGETNIKMIITPLHKQGIKQVKQCTYNVTPKRHHKTIACRGKAITITYFYASVRGCGCGCKEASMFLRACSLSSPVSNAHAPYCLRPLWLHHVFRHNLKNGTIFRGGGGGGLKLNVFHISFLSLSHSLVRVSCT